MKLNIKKKIMSIENPTVKEWYITIEKSIDKKDKEKDNKTNINLLKLLNKRKHIKVNLWKLNKYSKQDDNLIVPGKVLSVGNIDHKITICAIDFSELALQRLKKSDSNIIKIDQAINKTGNIKIII